MHLYVRGHTVTGALSFMMMMMMVVVSLCMDLAYNILLRLTASSGKDVIFIISV